MLIVKAHCKCDYDADNEEDEVVEEKGGGSGEDGGRRGSKYM